MQRSQKIIEPGKEDSSGENSDDTFVADPDREFLHYNELLARLDKLGFKVDAEGEAKEDSALQENQLMRGMVCLSTSKSKSKAESRPGAEEDNEII